MTNMGHMASLHICKVCLNIKYKTVYSNFHPFPMKLKTNFPINILILLACPQATILENRCMSLNNSVTILNFNISEMRPENQICHNNAQLTGEMQGLWMQQD